MVSLKVQIQVSSASSKLARCWLLLPAESSLDRINGTIIFLYSAKTENLSWQTTSESLPAKFLYSSLLFLIRVSSQWWMQNDEWWIANMA